MMNKQLTKRLTALTTAAALTLSLAVTGAGAAGAGNPLHTSRITISDSLDFVNTVSTHSAGREESYSFDYRPGGDVSVVTYSGDKLWGYSTIEQAAASLAAQGYYVLGGINADFFSSANGVPMGLVIRDGRLISSNDGRTAVAFREDGSAFLTRPTFRFTLTNQGGGDPATGLGLTQPAVPAGQTEDAAPTDQPGQTGDAAPADQTGQTGDAAPADQTGQTGDTPPAGHAGQTVEVHHYNKLRQAYYLYLLSSDFANSNKSTAWGRDVIFRIVEGQVTVSGQVTLEVTGVREGSYATELPEGCLVLTANAQSPYYDELTKFSVGDTVVLSVECDDPRLAEATAAVGGGDVLARGGSLTDPSTWDSAISTKRNPRTAIGIRPDGSVLFYAIDGRRSAHSNGLTLTELAEELIGLGCADVINLAGGGSTSLMFRTPTAASDTVSVVNMPSDGSSRTCSTFLFLVSNAESDGQAKNLYFTVSNPVVLTGATVSLGGIMARDGGYRPTAITSPLVFSVEGDGSFDAQQFLYTAGETARVNVIRATGLDESEGITTVTVVDEVSSISVTRKDTGAVVNTLALEAGDVVELVPTATALGRNALSSPSSFTYLLSGNIGSITEDGVFTAGTQRGASGSITVSFGRQSISIPVTVGEDNIRLVEDFEGLFTLFTDGDANMTVTSQASHVKLGHSSGALQYDFTQPDTAFTDYRFAAPVSFDRAPEKLSMWVCGDSSAVALSAILEDAVGMEHEAPFGVLDFTGYAQLTAETGLTGACRLVGFRIAAPAEGGKSGTLYLDQLVTPGSAPANDMTAPTITLSYENGMAKAQLSDNSGMTFTNETVSLTVDGQEASFELKDNTVTASAAFSDGRAHRLTVTAGDVFGNLARASLDVPAAEAVSSYNDVAVDHWAAPYIEFLSGQGVINGEGEGRFNPEGPMTREAFCTMLSRYLRLDAGQYAGVEAPFTDTASISDWALDHVKAMYSLGYVGGRANGDGTVSFAPSDPITRGEIFTLLGRLVGKGYENSFSAQFSDQDSIPDWAWAGVRTTVAMGLVGGYEDGTIRTESNATRAEVTKLLYFLY